MIFMAISAISRFPQELIDHVIDHVKWNEQRASYRHDDILLTYLNKLQVIERMDLRTCSLISKTWLPRSRYHLFYHVALRADGTHPLRFLKFLDSPLGQIAPHVRHLELYERTAECAGEFFWLNKALPRLAGLAAVESLSVYCGRFERLDDATLVAFFSRFSMLKYLRLKRCTFSSPTQLLDAISASAHLERLRLTDMDVARDSSSVFPSVISRLQKITLTKKGKNSVPASSRPVPSHLRILEVSMCIFFKEVLAWLQSGDDVPPVDTLWLNISNKDEMPAWSEFMRSIGSSLKDFTIRFTKDAGGFDSATAGTPSCSSQRSGSNYVSY
jgi:hypothetical protein